MDIGGGQDVGDRPSGRTGGARARLALTVAIGAAAGGLAGLFGVGGGILIVPGLVLLAGLGQRRAHGTSLAATAPLALAGVVGFALDGEVDPVVAALLLVGSAGGAVAGTAALRVIREDPLRYAFAGLLVVAAARMVVAVPPTGGRASLTAAGVAGLVAVGLLAGGVAGLMGIGGGIVMVPAQVLLFGVPTALAKGTSLAVIVPTALIGTGRNLRHGNLEPATAALVGLAGSATSFLGSRVAVGMDQRLSGILFAGLLLVAAVRLLIAGGRPGGRGRVGRSKRAAGGTDGDPGSGR